MRPGCDLKDAYYSVPIVEEHQKSLKLFCLGRSAVCLNLQPTHGNCPKNVEAHFSLFKKSA